MRKELQEIAKISSGYTFRGSIEKHLGVDIFVVQGKDISIDGDIFNIAHLAAISSDSIRNPYFLEYNDVLIVSRGSGPGSFRSSVFTSRERNVIASSSVIIIRPIEVTVLPKYISLYLNSSEGQKVISQIVTGGSYIQSILVKNLSELKIPIPPLHIQKSIISLHENIADQERILKRKQEIQKTIINASFTNLTKN